MKLRKTGHSWTVHSSPLEFVLIGPRLDAATDAERQQMTERDAVLVRTATLKPDLLALAIESRGEYPSSINLLLHRATRRRPASDLLHVLFGSPGGSSNRLRKLNAVRGEKSMSPDGRSSNYVFAWAGKVDDFDKSIVESTVRRYLADLRAGLQGEDPERIEWALAPIVYHCMLVTTGTTDEPDRTRQFARQARLNSYLSVFIAVISMVFAILSTIFSSPRR